MADYLLYQLGIDSEARDYVRRVSDGATVELGRRPDYGEILAEVPGAALIVNLSDPDTVNQDVGHLDLTTGALEVIPKIDGFSYRNQTFTPLDGGFFIAGHEPIFYRPGEGAFQLAEIDKGTGLSEFSSPENVVSLGSGVLFTADDGRSVGIWYQGDPDTTTPVRISETDGAGRSMFLASTIQLAQGEAVDDRFVFSTVGGRANQKTVYSVGAEPGSVEELPGGGIRDVSDFDSFGGALYFAGAGPDDGSRFALWRTDGTAAGTTPITIEMLEAVSPLAGLSDDEGGIRFNSRISDPIVVGERMFVVVLADTITLRPPDQGGFEINPIRPMIFEIGTDGTPRFSAETDVEVTPSLRLDNGALGTHTAGGRILLPDAQGAIHGIDPDTGASEQILSRIGGLFPENDLYEPYGDGSLIFLDRRGSSDLLAGDARSLSRDIIVTDGTAAGTIKLDELAIPTLPTGLNQPRSGFTSVSNKAIYWQTPDFMLLAPEARAPAQVVFDGVTDPDDRDTSFTGRGLFEGPDDLLAILAAAQVSQIVGGAGRDTLPGTAEDDIIDGGQGDDVLIGRDGNDTLRGGDGNDVLLSNDPGDARSTGAQVFRLYQATLDRAPDTAGLRGWVDAISSGNTTLAQVATGFITSTEFRTTYGTQEELGAIGFLELLYENILGRAPDPAGQQTWLDVLQDGASTESVVLGFSESAEFRANTAAAATAFADAGLQNAWVDDVYRLYQATLDRTPDRGGLEGWTAALAQGGAFEDVVTGFVASTEFQQTYGALDDRGFVTLLYNNVLGRDPDETGLAGWLARLTDGTARETVVSGFSQSAEFRTATAAATQTFMRTQTGDILDGGPGDDILAGGIGADSFVFRATDTGRNKVLHLDAWDTLVFEGFGYDSRAELLDHFSTRGPDVVFADNGVEVTLAGTLIGALSDIALEF